ncbi:MAG: hypothetical protein E5299_00668 [Burkholderia gladioli]|nr:MAG: hypothetical protein E5299_00668 [Burkholderia gladioli]
MSSAVRVPTTPSHAMQPSLHAVLFLRIRHTRAPLLGQRICPGAAWRNGARLMQLPVMVVENESQTVATTGYRLPRMRCIGSRTLTGNCLWARHIDAQVTEVAVRSGVIKPHGRGPACPQSIRIA